MEPNSRAVKAPRRYDASRRREAARRNRDAVVDAATRRFLADGFGATTIAAIAAEARVSPDTVFKAFGNKSGLVRAVVDRALAGDRPKSSEERSDALQREAPSGEAITRGFGELSAEVAPRVAPILLLLAAAGEADPALAELRTEIDNQRLGRMTANAGVLAERGFLKPGLSIERAAQICWTCSSPELYRLLVVEQGWSAADYGAWVGDVLTHSLLASGTDARGA